jgi:DNA (cytosine-5)-methyltransferase 1
MAAYYNEIDKQAAAWLRELIKQGVISDGEVDERSIEDVLPADLAGFERVHFFAGIAIWDYALTQAGFDRPVWTGSCPCQPFSAAGKGEGFADERHLWPAWFHLIDVLRPGTIFGEQVSSTDGLTWIDLVFDDLEGAGYSVRPLDIPACSVGAPHIRNRLFFQARNLADTKHKGRDDRSRPETGRNNHYHGRITPTWREGRINGRVRTDTFADGSTCIVADSKGYGRGQRFSVSEGDSIGNGPGQKLRPTDSGASGILADSHGSKPRGRYCEKDEAWKEIRIRSGIDTNNGSKSGELGHPHGTGLQGLGRFVEQHDTSGRNRTERHNSETSFWSNADWIYCTDGKYRPVEAGTFPLATGHPARVGLLRGYGNSINGPLTQAFIESCEE